MMTPRQSERRVARRLLIFTIVRLAILPLLMVLLIVKGLAVAALVLAVLVLGFVLTGLRIIAWQTAAAYRRARASGQPPFWNAGVPPAAFPGQQLPADRNVPGRLTWTPAGFAWHPRFGPATALAWDPSWRPVLDRPWFLRITGAGRLTLSRAGDEDAILWVTGARDFDQVTG